MDASSRISTRSTWSASIRTTRPPRGLAAKAQQTVDNAQMRYFIVHLHRLLDPEAIRRRAGALTGRLSHAVAARDDQVRLGSRRRSGWPRRNICAWSGTPRASPSSRRISTSRSPMSADHPGVLARPAFPDAVRQAARAARQGADLAPPRRRDQRHRRRAARHRDHPRLGTHGADFAKKGGVSGFKALVRALREGTTWP